MNHEDLNVEHKCPLCEETTEHAPTPMPPGTFACNRCTITRLTTTELIGLFRERDNGRFTDKADEVLDSIFARLEAEKPQ